MADQFNFARRAFLSGAGAAALLACASKKTVVAPTATAVPPTSEPPAHEMAELLAIPGATGHAEKIAIVLYPGFTLLDVVGPHHIFINLLGAEVLFVAASMEPVMTDTGVPITPTTTFAQCPRDLTVLCVPGGTTGTVAAMEDAATIAFVADRGARAKWVTSVCTGSLILGAAGLLDGYRATSHWMTRDILADLGATPINARVVADKNRLTGAGVTAGIDFALTLAVTLRGETYAQAVQLFSEYAPAPPLSAGVPETAPPAVHHALSEMMKGFVADARTAARRVRAQKGA